MRSFTYHKSYFDQSLGEKWLIRLERPAALHPVVKTRCVSFCTRTPEVLWPLPVDTMGPRPHRPYRKYIVLEIALMKTWCKCTPWAIHRSKMRPKASSAQSQGQLARDVRRRWSCVRTCFFGDLHVVAALPRGVRASDESGASRPLSPRPARCEEKHRTEDFGL